MLHALIAQRRSPRAYDAHKVLSAEQVQALLEAARWAPSAMNRQPWVFLVGHRGDATFKGIADSLSGNNQLWAPAAGALIVALVDNHDAAAGTDPLRAYEVGLAVGQLGVQATAMGLITHQMGGFDPEQLRDEFAIPERLRPVVVIAVGHAGDAAALPARLQRAEHAPRVRKDMADLVQTQPWSG